MKISDLEGHLNPLAHLPETINQNKAELQRLRVYQQKWEALKAGQESWEQLLLQEKRLASRFTQFTQRSPKSGDTIGRTPKSNVRLEANLNQLTPLLSALTATQNRERELHARLFSRKRIERFV